MLCTRKVRRRNLIRRQSHRRPQIGPHGALRIRSHQRKTLRIGHIAFFKARQIRTNLRETVFVKLSRLAIAELPEETRPFVPSFPAARTRYSPRCRPLPAWPSPKAVPPICPRPPHRRAPCPLCRPQFPQQNLPQREPTNQPRANRHQSNLLQQPYQPPELPQTPATARLKTPPTSPPARSQATPPAQPKPQARRPSSLKHRPHPLP